MPTLIRTESPPDPGDSLRWRPSGPSPPKIPPISLSIPLRHGPYGPLMEIENGKVVRIDYTLKNDRGEVVDSSEGREPLSFLHGVGQLLPRLEEEMVGHGAGDTLEVSLSPAEGYGEREEDKVGQIPRSSIGGEGTLEVGTTLQASGPEGETILQVTEVGEENVTVDANHPLAGENLHFTVTVQEVREPTPEEKEHGHAHGPGGHQH